MQLFSVNLGVCVLVVYSVFVNAFWLDVLLSISARVVLLHHVMNPFFFHDFLLLCSGIKIPSVQQHLIVILSGDFC